MHKSINKSMEANSGRTQGRFKSLMDVEHTPKANSGTRKSRFDHPTINISTNQAIINNSFCMANIAINNIKSTVKSRERSNGDRSIPKTSNTTTNAQAKLKYGIDSRNAKKSYFQLDPQSFQLQNMQNLFPQTETHKATLYQKIQAMKHTNMTGQSIDGLKDIISPKGRNHSHEKSYFEGHTSKSLNKTQQNTRGTFISQHQKTDDSFSGLRERTTQTIIPSKTVESIDNDTKSWDDLTLPITPEDALKNFSQYLNENEKREILQYMNIFYLGHKANKKQKSQLALNYDDDKGDYKYAVNDHVGYRYEILEPLGKGSFGSVVRVFDHKRREEAALKIIRSKKKFFNQALVELKILKFIKDNDPQNQTNIVKIKDFVIFRNHVCIVFELLSINLYEFLKSNNFSGVSLELIRRFAIQILQSLMFLEKAKIVHCDLKPENILLKQINKSGIKIVDFGSSCFVNERVYTYIQSRFYRAPEVILGLPYSNPIDMWSFGCIISELFMGYPLFPGENEQEQMQMFMELLGAPTNDFLEPCQRRSVFFTNKSPYVPLLPPNSKNKVRQPASKTLNHYLKCNDETFVSFVKACFTWEMDERMRPAEALVHPWILQGLPTEIRLQHLLQMQLNAPHLKLDEQIRQIRDSSPASRVNNDSSERKPYNNYFLKKQPNLTISLNKAQSIGKDVQSTKNQQHPIMSTKHQKNDLSTKNKSNQFVFTSENESRTTKNLSKQNRSYQFNVA